MDSMDELRSPSRPTSPAASIIVFPLPSTLFVLQLLGTIRCPEKPRAAQKNLIDHPTSALRCPSVVFAAEHLGRERVAQRTLHAGPGTVRALARNQRPRSCLRRSAAQGQST